MRKIYAVTGNEGKRLSIQTALDDLNLDIQMVNPEEHGIIEPQHNDVAVVALSKAKQAWDILKKPLIVEDGGYHLCGLNNFPGAYSKPIWGMLGVEGFVKLMQGVENRKCFFKGTLCYVDANGESHLFEESNHGIFSSEVGQPHPKQWGQAWQVFIPDGFDKVMSEMTDDEFQAYRTSREQSESSRWKKLREHLLNE